jgi:hypothetical protein
MLKIAVICRQKGHAELRQKVGWWSYPVPDLKWTLLPQAAEFAVNTAALQEVGFDAIVHEDWVRGDLVGHHLPTFYSVVDSNTSERRRDQYRAYAQGLPADVILLDQDEPALWTDLGRRVHRWQYAVNEHRFRPLVKTVDVACHLAPTEARRELGGRLAAFGQQRPYLMALAHSLPSGEYADALGRAKIVVHLPTHPQCRTHRVFDALAAGCCLLTAPLPCISGDGFIPGQHYHEWHDWTELATLIDHLLVTGGWQDIAAAGRAFVLRHHTWQTRAAELAAIMRKEFKCLN